METDKPAGLPRQMAVARQRIVVEKREAVLAALRQLMDEDEEISIASVAARAGVSRQFIYGKSDLKLHVDVVKEQKSRSKKSATSPARVGPVADAALRSELKLAHDEIVRLRRLNREIKASLRVDLGSRLDDIEFSRNRDLLSAKTQDVDRLQSEMHRLRLELAAAKRELENAQEDLVAERRANLRLAGGHLA